MSAPRSNERAVLSRRCFCQRTAMLAAWCGVGRYAVGQGASGVHFNVAEWDRARILALAETALKSPSIQLETLPSALRAKVPDHTFYSEAAADRATGDDERPTENFTAHADALVLLNLRVGASVAAWQLTRGAQHFENAWRLLRVWFLSPATAMQPQLDFAGSRDDRGTAAGIRDVVSLAELARASSFLCADPAAPAADVAALRAWFAALLTWMDSSRLGVLARDSADLSAICWTAIAAEAARLAGNYPVQRDATHRFRDRLLRQMNFDGAFPQALTTRQPFGTSLFMLECLSLACESLSTPFSNLWRYQLPDGRGMHSAVAFHMPAMADRGKWPYTADAEHFSELPVRGAALLLAARSLDLPTYVDVWKRLRADPVSAAVARTTPVREPALWAQRPPA